MSQTPALMLCTAIAPKFLKRFAFDQQEFAELQICRQLELLRFSFLLAAQSTFKVLRRKSGRI